MFEKIKTLYDQMFTKKKFPDKRDKKAIGDKKVGEVYDVTYTPDPEEPGKMIIVFGKKEDELK